MKTIAELRAAIVARHERELAEFDSKSRDLVALAERESPAMVRTVPNIEPPALKRRRVAEVLRRNPGVVIRVPRNGKARDGRCSAVEPGNRTAGSLTKALRAAGLEFHGEFTIDALRQIVGAACPDNRKLGVAIGGFLRTKEWIPVRRGVYRVKTVETPAPAPKEPKEPRPAINPGVKNLPQSLGRSKGSTECHQAMRRAIALITTTSTTFNREDLTGLMDKDVGERTVKGWALAGSIGAALVDLREMDVIKLVEHKPPALAVYELGPKWAAEPAKV